MAIVASQLGRVCHDAVLLRRAAVPATPALALALTAAVAATVATLVAAAVAGHVWVLWTSRVGYGSESTTPARAGAARAGGGEEGGAGDRLFVVGETELLECQHVMGSGECGKYSGVGDVVGGVGEARIEAAKEGEDEL